jgi:hypothetical protein
VLATIEAKWNLPALTYRHANAATVLDFLDTSAPALLTPPTIGKPLPVKTTSGGSGTGGKTRAKRVFASAVDQSRGASSALIPVQSA